MSQFIIIHCKDGNEPVAINADYILTIYTGETGTTITTRQNQIVWCTETMDEILQMIDEQPTVDAQSVRHGKWRHYGRMLTCSECGTMFYDDIMEYCGNAVPRYCPNCGADMRGEKE